MKSLKIVFASLFLVFGAIAVSSFTLKSYNSKAFADVCYDYDQIRENLVFGQTNSIVESAFKTPGNWDIVTDDPEVVCSANNFICRLCFDDSQLSETNFQNVLNALYAYLNSIQPSVPTHGALIPLTVQKIAGGTKVVNVTVYEKPQ